MKQIEGRRLAAALRWRASLLQAAIALHIGWTILVLSLASIWLGSTGVYAAFNGRELSEPIGALLVTLVAGWPTTGLVLLVAPLWVWRAHANLRTLGLPRLVYPPLLTTISWFVPLIGLVVPPLAMRELWNRSESRDRHEQGKAHVVAIAGWWACLIGGALLQVLFYTAVAIPLTPELRSIAAPLPVAIIGALGTLLMIAAYGLLWVIVRRITRSQQVLVLSVTVPG